MDLGHHTQVTRTLIAGVGRKSEHFSHSPTSRMSWKPFRVTHEQICLKINQKMTMRMLWRDPCPPTLYD